MMSKYELFESIDEINEQLAKNKGVIDEYAGKTEEEIGSDLFNAVMRLCELTELLIIKRMELNEQLSKDHGIWIFS